MNEDDLWIVEHFSELVTKYAGKYIAVVNETLVAVGDSGKEVEDKARQIEPHKIPYEAKGLKPAGAFIAAYAEWVGADVLVTENRHFLNHHPDLPFKVLTAEKCLNLI